MDRHPSRRQDIPIDDQQIKRWLVRNAVLSTLLVAGFAIMTMIGSGDVRIKTSLATTAERASAGQSDSFELRQPKLPLQIQPISLNP